MSSKQMIVVNIVFVYADLGVTWHLHNSSVELHLHDNWLPPSINSNTISTQAHIDILAAVVFTLPCRCVNNHHWFDMQPRRGPYHRGHHQCLNLPSFTSNSTNSNNNQTCAYIYTCKVSWDLVEEMIWMMLLLSQLMNDVDAGTVTSFLIS